jgi:hypothetical protein
MLNEKQFNNMINDCKKINNDYDFCSLVAANNGGINDKKETLYWFHFLWNEIPLEYLLKTYKELLTTVECGAGYNDFFNPEILVKISTVNKYDTLGNKTLNSLCDKNGELTIFHGHCKNTMRNSNSWTLNKDIAIWFGKRNSMFYRNPTFYCVTGKVKLDDVITFITERNEDEIVVLQKNVRNKEKEFYKSIDIDLKKPYEWERKI